MFRRKLAALEYPGVDSFDINDSTKVRSLVFWLEDQKIRNYKTENRTELKNIKGANWDTAFNKYLQDIPITIKTSRLPEILDWLLCYAVNLEYRDNVDKYSKSEENGHSAPKMITSNPLDKLDFSSKDFIDGVNALADHFGMSKHPNYLVTLEAIAKLVKDKMSAETLQIPEDKRIAKGTPFPFQELDAGFDTGDYVLNNAAKILRLLYIHDLRDLQTKINECIVQIQTITSNPKTDTRLGKVGF